MPDNKFKLLVRPQLIHRLRYVGQNLVSRFTPLGHSLTITTDYLPPAIEVQPPFPQFLSTRILHTKDLDGITKSDATVLLDPVTRKLTVYIRFAKLFTDTHLANHPWTREAIGAVIIGELSDTAPLHASVVKLHSFTPQSGDVMQEVKYFKIFIVSQ